MVEAAADVMRRKTRRLGKASEDLRSRKETTKVLKIGESTLRKLEQRGLAHPYTVGRRKLYSRDEVQRLRDEIAKGLVKPRSR